MADGSAHDHATVAEIRARFDADVERFSNLDTGQAAVVDAPLHLELVTRAAAEAANGESPAVVDVGCGAGNYTLKLLEALGAKRPSRIALVDLSRPMLDRAAQRVGAVYDGPIEPVQADVRGFDFGSERWDVVMAAQCLHHLRDEDQWRAVFAAVVRGLRPGGGFWISDSIAHDIPAVDRLMRQRWAEHLESLGGATYRRKVEAYVEHEDTPRPLAWQLDLLRRSGLEAVDVLHASARFASFGGVKRSTG